MLKKGMEKEVDLRAIANRLRQHALRMTTKAGSGHVTSSLSMAELMSCVFFDEMYYNRADPEFYGNDELVLSKGHATPLLWAAFAEAGLIPIKKLDDYRKYMSPLEGHPTPNMPWVKVATGSLGQGLSAGLGMALAARMKGVSSRVFVMMGDGECAEGSVWEAAELASKLDISNLVAVVDCNRLGQSGESLHGHEIKRWQEKFTAFGWNTFVIDGHNVKDILDALSEARTTHGPSVIVAKTVKGKGVSFLENKEGWHGKALSESECAQALAELGPVADVNPRKVERKFAKLVSLKERSPAGPKYNVGGMVATREAYGSMLEKLGVNEKVVALDADVKNSTFSEKFKAKYPERFIDCFIAEQNMVGMAAGLSAKGFVPFVNTFAAFFTRAHDQLRMCAISGSNIKFCGSHCGVSIGEDGPSQMGLEDIALFRSLPESVVLYPCDAVSAEKCAALLAESKGIGYLRTTRPKTPVIYKNSASFRIGGSKTVKSGFRDKVVIVTAGVTVHEALKAAELVKDKIKVRVIDAYSIKPLDASTIKSAANGRKVVVIEDHYAEGGLGEAVASLGIPITHICVKNIPRSGSQGDLMKACGLDAESIAKVVGKL